VPADVEPDAPLVVTAEYFDRLWSGEGMPGPSQGLVNAIILAESMSDGIAATGVPVTFDGVSVGTATVRADGAVTVTVADSDVARVVLGGALPAASIGFAPTPKTHVYTETESGLWTVGYYTPFGAWVAEQDYDAREDAEAMTRVLNGLVHVDGVTPAALSYLIGQAMPTDEPTCRVCGSGMRLSEMSGGRLTYNCDSPEADILRNGELGSSGHRAAQQHRRQSEAVIASASLGNADVLVALRELQKIRSLRGEDMAVPVGTFHYPHGHTDRGCWRRHRHVGGDHWVEDHDLHFTHDPSHGPAGAGKTEEPSEVQA
jgi:hypothetical protein